MTKILVVDDEPSILRSTELLLNDLGFDVVTTPDPRSVLAMLARERPDLLLQDVRMPGLDLAQLVAAIRADPLVRHVPVLLFSASMDLPDIQARVGAAGFLEKPFKPEEVVHAIRRALAPVPTGSA